jgi:hypothetical protein
MQADATEQRHPGGRPSLYRPEHVDLARRMAHNGATRDEIADELGIDNATLHRWMLAHEEFRDAVKIGREHADERVVHALYHRALNGSDTATIFWLKNRQPKLWRDKHEVSVNVTHSVRDMSAAELLALIEQPAPLTIDHVPAAVDGE